jgi:hypothetical protein
MELTPEDKQRIEKEERKRVAEEQYRAEVRAKATGAKSSRPWVLGPLIVALIVALIVWSNVSTSSYARAAHAAAKNEPKMHWVPVDQKIATGQVVVKPNGYAFYRIVITNEMVTPVLTGHFTASGGFGNDIMAVVADEPNYINWINGHQAQVFWNTQGRETTGSFELRLRQGVYYFALSNRFSLLMEKQVFLDVDLNYKKMETESDGTTE